MGMTVEMQPSKGPHFPNPLLSPDDEQFTKVLQKDVNVAMELEYVFKAITLTRYKLNGRVPLIGFCGSPWTLFCYMVEGGASKMFIDVKTWIYRYPEASTKLLQRIAEICVEYLALQIKAGAQARKFFQFFFRSRLTLTRSSCKYLTPWQENYHHQHSSDSQSLT